MMQFLILIICTVLFFVLTMFGRYIKDGPVLIAVAIGCACNANLFNTTNYPIILGDIYFSISPILYVLFMNTVVIKVLDYSPKSGSRLMITSIAAIIISATIELVAHASYTGAFKSDNLFLFLFYILSSIGTIVGCLLIELFVTKVKIKNKYLLMFICLITACVIHMIPYHLGLILMDNDYIKILPMSIVGEFIEMISYIFLGLLCYFINNKYLPANTTR